jgi:hypothetical protein
MTATDRDRPPPTPHTWHPPARLTLRQQWFIEALLTDARSGADAARKAGYSTRRAEKRSYELLRHPAVQQAIHARLRAMAHELGRAVEAAIVSTARRGDPHAGRELYRALRAALERYSAGG